MDPAEDSSVLSAMEFQGTMLGRHEQELTSARRTVEMLASRVAELSDQLHSLQFQQGLGPSTTTRIPQLEPRVNNPPVYSGEPSNCRSFLTQCEVVFSLQPQTYASERTKVAFIISLLAGRARDWGAAVWEAEDVCCLDFHRFKEEMIKTFDRSVFGKEASRLLAALQQGRRSVADYAIEFRTLAATSEWNQAALSARFLDGLTDIIKDEIYARDPPERFDELVSLAIRLDHRFDLRRRVLMGSRPEATELPPAAQLKFGPTEPEPMQVGRLRLTAEEKQRRLSKGLCLYCGGQGHVASLCPVKASARQ